MRTTLDLNDRLLRQAKEAAAREQVTLTSLIEQGLRLRLRPRPARAVNLPPLPVSDRTGGFRPGINPFSNRSLLDAADASEDAFPTIDRRTQAASRRGRLARRAGK